MIMIPDGVTVKVGWSASVVRWQRVGPTAIQSERQHIAFAFDRCLVPPQIVSPYNDLTKEGLELVGPKTVKAFMDTINKARRGPEPVVAARAHQVTLFLLLSHHYCSRGR
jgi:hypothetical protein